MNLTEEQSKVMWKMIYTKEAELCYILIGAAYLFSEEEKEQAQKEMNVLEQIKEKIVNN